MGLPQASLFLVLRFIASLMAPPAEGYLAVLTKIKPGWERPFSSLKVNESCRSKGFSGIPVPFTLDRCLLRPFDIMAIYWVNFVQFITRHTYTNLEAGALARGELHTTHYDVKSGGPHSDRSQESAF